MEALVGILIGLVVSQGGLIWYKIGRLESSVKALAGEVHNSNNSKKGG